METKYLTTQTKIESTTPTGEVSTSPVDLRSAYLDLLKKSLTGLIATEEFVPVNLSTPRPFVPATLLKLTSKYLPSMNMKLVHQIPIDIAARTEGRDWPANAHTMVGLKRLGNLQSCIEDIIENDVPGDQIETGVWRGGATIF
jgi:O-methyltransferase